MTATYEDICAFLYREARFLDDRAWDDWLTCYAPDASFWMPAWTEEDTLVQDPASEISLIYYPNRDGLEDRVFRIKTERSGASTPEPRTTHMIANVEVTARQGTTTDVRFNWHTLCFRYTEVTQFFGVSFYGLDLSGPEVLIKRKKVVLKNDHIPQVLDVYHV